MIESIHPVGRRRAPAFCRTIQSIVLACLVAASAHLAAQGPTNVLLVNGRLPSSQGVDTLVQFSGGGAPLNLRVGTLQAQVDVLERKPDGSPRVFRGLAPVRGSVSQGFLQFRENGAGTPHPLSGNYSTNFDPLNLEFKLANAAGDYTVRLANASDVSVVVGPGNPKGHSGADYLRITRYFCPLTNPSLPAPHQTCGAMVVYVTQRVDLRGYIVECLFANSSLAGPVTTYNGDTPENPGHVVFRELSFEPRLNNYQVVHADTYVFAGGTQGNVLAKDPGNGGRHLSSPGTAPGWMFAVTSNSTPSDRTTGMLEGLDSGIAYSGRGFHPGSNYGFGPNEFRHDDPDLWPNDSKNAMRTRVLSDVSALRGHIAAGTPVGGGSGSLRDGIYQAFGILNPNGTGGVDISGHSMEQPVPEYIAYLKLGSMMATRRSNHSFYLWDGSRPLLPADAVVQWSDPTLGEEGDIDVSLLFTADVGAGTSGSIPSTQFSCVSPLSDIVIGFRGNGNSMLPGANEQGTNGPSTRTWNQLQVGESFSFPSEDVASHVGYSHNLGHSPRFFVAREAYLFGLSMLGYDLATNYAAFAACHHLAYDVDSVQQNWRFSRPLTNLHAWGARDLAGMTVGSGRPHARRRGGDGKLGALNSPSGSTNFGQQRLDYITNRSLAWSMIWQYSGTSIGDDSYRSATSNNPNGAHNPARLFATFIVRLQTSMGVTSQSETNLGTNLCFEDIASNGGSTNLTARTGGLPGGPTKSDTEHWTATLGFQDVYMALAVDATTRHFPTSIVGLFQPARERIYWQLIQNELNAEPGTGRIGIPYCPPASRGLLGWPADVFAPANPVATENDLRSDLTRWIYTNTPMSPPPNGWGHNLPNSSLGALAGLREMSLVKRAEFASLLKRQWGLTAAATTDQLLQKIRMDTGTYDGYLGARIAPFLAEAALYLP